MTTLSREKIANIAQKASLRLTDEELDKYADINEILKLAEQITSIDIPDNITPMAHPLQIYQRLREDKVTKTNERELLQTTTTHTELGLYLVPQVIE